MEAGTRQERNACSKCGTRHRWKECPAYGQRCTACNMMNHWSSFCPSNQGIRNSRSCYNCGTRHRRGQCPAYGDTCGACGKINHWSSVCLSRQQAESSDESDGEDTPRRNDNSQTGNGNGCYFCGTSHRRGQCPAYGDTCGACGKLNHWSSVCSTRQVESSDESDGEDTPRRNDNSQSRNGNSCYNCGTRHKRGQCPAYGATCGACGKMNHWSSVCLTSHVESSGESEDEDMKMQTDTSRPRNASNCYSCGTNHKPGQCPALGAKCGACGKMNHWSLFCLTKHVMNQDSSSEASSYEDFEYSEEGEDALLLIDITPQTERSIECHYCGLVHVKGHCSAFGKQCSACNKMNHFVQMCPAKVQKETERFIECHYCGLVHEEGHCPAFGKECSACNKMNHFAQMCPAKVQKKTERSIECHYCGLVHEKGHCPAFGKECSACNKMNHFAQMCPAKVQKEVENVNGTNDTKQNETYQIVDAIPINSHSNGAIPENSQSNGAISKNSQSTGAIPKNSQSNGAIPKDSQSTGAIPKNSQSTGAIPKNSQSNGAIPKDSQSTGAIPKNSQSTGAIPKNSQSTGTAVIMNSQSNGAIPKNSQSTGAIPKNSQSTGAIPKNSQSTGAIPKNSQSTGAAAALNYQSTSTIPKNYQSTGAIPKNSQSSGAILKNSQSTGAIPKNPQSTGAIPKNSRSTVAIPKNPLSIGAIPKNPQSTGAIPKNPQSTGAIPKNYQSTGVAAPLNSLSNGEIQKTSQSNAAAPKNSQLTGTVPKHYHLTGAVLKNYQSNVAVPQHHKGANAVSENTIQSKGTVKEKYCLREAVQNKVSSDVSKCFLPLCTLKHDKVVKLQVCGHSFFRNCLARTIVELGQGSMKCPAVISCAYIIPQGAIGSILTPEEWIGYKESERKFQCQTPGCSTWCAYRMEVTYFQCPSCSQVNCLLCQSIHSGRPCEKSVDGLNGKPQKVKVTKNYSKLLDLYELSVVPCDVNFCCPICLEDYGPMQGIILKECFHKFCMQCLKNTINSSDDADIKCPAIDPTPCASFLCEDEIKGILSPGEYDKRLEKTLLLAESKTSNSFHCLTPNCKGWCEVENGARSFACPVCSKTSCLICNIIHKVDETCDEYRQSILDNDMSKDEIQPEDGTYVLKPVAKLKAYNRRTISGLIARGDAMRCPGCTVLITKISGCDGLTCTYCKLLICWITKQPRWGPKGVGDISGGCRCKVNGVRCHPQCGNCH